MKMKSSSSSLRNSEYQCEEQDCVGGGVGHSLVAKRKRERGPVTTVAAARRAKRELNEKEIYMRAQNPLEYLVKSNYNRLRLEIPSDSNQIVIGLLRNTAYQRIGVYYTTSTISRDRHRYQVMRLHNTLRVDGDEARFEEVFAALLGRVSLDCKEVNQYVKCLPGFDTLNPLDFNTLLNENFMCIHGLLISELYADNECFSAVVDGITFTRKWHEKWVGKETSDLMFKFEQEINRLRLTQSEMSLIVPYLLSMFDRNDNNLVYPEKAQKLHDLYKNAMLKEFELGKRDQKFRLGLAKCFSMLVECGKSLKSKSLIPESLQPKLTMTTDTTTTQSDLMMTDDVPRQYL